MSTTSRHLRSLSLAVTVACLMLGALAPGAHAGAFTVYTCHPASGYTTNHAFQGNGGNAGGSNSTTQAWGCQLYGNDFLGTKVTYPGDTSYWGSWASVGAFAVGTTYISGYSADVAFSKSGGGQAKFWVGTHAAYPSPTSGVITGPINAGDTYGWNYPGSGYTPWSQSGLNVPDIALAVAYEGCGCNGNSQALWSNITLTITEDSAPSMTAGTGGMWSGGTISGNQSVGWTANDSTGILRDSYYIDSNLIQDTGNYGCDYSYMDPCNHGGNPGPIFYYNTANLADGSHTIQIYSMNTGGIWGGATSSLTTDNYPPNNTALPAVSGSTVVDQTLTSTTGTWTNNNNVNYTYQWERCNTSGASCANISGATASTYVQVWADLGSTLRSQVTLCDPIQGCRTAVSAATAVITGYPPVNTVVPAVTGNRVVGQTLTTDSGTWTKNQNANYTYQWARCDTNGANCVTISGATATTYALVDADLGYTIRSQVTLCNPGSNCAAAVQSVPTGVVVKYPVNVGTGTTPPVVSGTDVVAQTLTTTTGTWTSNVNTNYTYQWQRCDTSGANCNAVTGATASTYTLVWADLGMTMRSQVTLCNPGGLCTTATSAQTPVVTGYSPTNTAVPTVSPTPAVTGQTLTSTTGTWTNNQTTTYTYQWETCDSSGNSCTNLPGATSATYTPQLTDVGSTLRSQVTLCNPGVNCTTATSAPTSVVVDKPPTINGGVNGLNVVQNLTNPISTKTVNPDQYVAAALGTLTVSTTITDGGSGLNPSAVVLQDSPANANTWTTVSSCTASGSTYSCPLNTASIGDGPLDLRVRAADNAGGTSFSQPTFTIIVDNTTPTDTTTAPFGWQSSTTVTVPVTASDGSGSGVGQTSYQVDTGAVTTTAGGPVNQVADPSLETNLEGWNAGVNDYWLNSGASISRVSSQQQSGTWAMQVATSGTTNYTGTEYPVSGTFTAGTPYTFSVYLKGNAGGEALQVAAGNGADNNTTSTTLTTGWQRVAVTWTPTSARTLVNLAVRTTTAAALTFYLDAAQLTQSAAAVTYADTQTPPATANAVVTGEGVHTLKSQIVDAAGNISPWKTQTVSIDNTAPTLTVTDAAGSAWVNTDQQASIQANDPALSGGGSGSGVAAVYYTYVNHWVSNYTDLPPNLLSCPAGAPATICSNLGDSGQILNSPATASFATTKTLTNEGSRAIKVWAVDGAGNVSAPAVIQVNIDKTAPNVPIITGVSSGQSIANQVKLYVPVMDIALTGAPDGSGVAAGKIQSCNSDACAGPGGMQNPGWTTVDQTADAAVTPSSARCAPAMTQTGGQYACTLDTQQYLNGNYYLRAVASDVAGNMAFGPAVQALRLRNSQSCPVVGSIAAKR